MKYLFRNDKTVILSDSVDSKQNYEENFMASLHGWDSIASWVVEPLRGGSLLFPTKFPEIPGTHLINLRKMKGSANLGATQRCSTWKPWIGNSVP